MLARSTTPVLTGPLRRPTAILATLALVGLGALALRFAGVEGPGPLEARLDARVQHTFAPYRRFLRKGVSLAGPSSVAAAAVLLAVVCLALRRPRLAVFALAGPALTGLATTVLQPAIGRTLDGGYALPSGHAAGAAAVATVIALVVISLSGWRARFAAVLGSAAVFAVGATMAIALVSNGLHYTSDTVAGTCTAVAVVLCTAHAVDAVADRRRAGPGASATAE